MRLAHLADLHLGFRQYARLTPHGINQREADVAAAFRTALDGVIAAAPDLIVIAGDVFHTVRPSNTAIFDAFRQFQRVRAALPGTPIVLVAGNHDTPRAVETGSILRLYEAVPGVHAVITEARRLDFAELDLALLCVPHAALAGERPAIAPDPARGVNVLVLHGDVTGVVQPETPGAEFGGSPIEPALVRRPGWDYVALGHYHVPIQVSDQAWYAGALCPVTHNLWGEAGERGVADGAGRKGWLLVEPGRPPLVTFQPVPAARLVVDLPAIHAAGLEADAISATIRDQAGAVRGGVDGAILRQVVWDVARATARDLDHALVRDLKARALHYHLDLRRPDPVRRVGMAAPGTRRTLPELVDAFLVERPLPPGVDRDALRRLAADTLDAVARETDATA